MAVYIDDTGGYGFDAHLIGVEDTAWSRNTTDNSVWFSSTGTCETGLTLPNSEWIVYEVYENDAQANDLTGGTNVYAWIEYTTTIGTIATTLSTWYTAWDSEATTRGYTTYSVKATHYKGSDLADVYDADDTGTFGTATTTNGTYTGHGSEWVLSDALLADGVSSLDIELNLDTINTDGSGLRTLDNTGLTGATNDAELHGSNLVYLDGSTQNVQIPLQYTLGSELKTLPFDLTNMTKSGDVYTATAIDGYIGENIADSAFTTDEAIIMVTATATAIPASGNAYLLIGRQSPWSNSIDRDLVANVPLSIVYSYSKTDGLTSYFPRVYVDTSGQSVTVPEANWSVKEVTVSTAAVIYYDQATKVWIKVTEYFTLEAGYGNTEISYRIEDSFSHACALSVEPTTADLTFLNANPEALVDMWDGTSYAGDLSFDVDDIENLYVGSEGQEGVDANIYDITDQTWATYAVIENSAASCRTTYENVDYGPTNFRYVQDSSGRVTGMSTVGELSGASDGRNVLLPLNSPEPYLVTECIDHIKGDTSSLTITDCDAGEHVVDSSDNLMDLTSLAELNNALGGADLTTTMGYGEFDIEVDVIGDSASYPRINMDYTAALEIGPTYRYSFDYNLISANGNDIQFKHYVNNGYTRTETITTASTTWTRDVESEVASENTLLWFNATELFNIEITNFSVVKL